MARVIGPIHGIMRYNARVAQTRENTSRLAITSLTFESTGWGEFTNPDVGNFGITFIEEPSVSYGNVIDGDSLIDTRFPRCSGGVYRWKFNNKGFFTGAWVYFTVDTGSPESTLSLALSPPNYTITHSFTFSGVAYKDVPVDPKLLGG